MAVPHRCGFALVAPPRDPANDEQRDLQYLDPVAANNAPTSRKSAETVTFATRGAYGAALARRYLD